jgi:hypothetical protein
MDEYVLASTAVWLNKPITLGRIEPVRTENLIRVDDVMESPKLAE